MYATVDELRDEGVSVQQASDDRLRALLEDASLTIDGFTRRFFEPRDLTLRFSGRRTSSLSADIPLLALDRLWIGDTEVQEPAEELMRPTGPLLPGHPVSDLRLLDGRIFPAGYLNVSIEGTWGYTEADGILPQGRTPPAIQRVCKQLVIRALPRLADAGVVGDAAMQWRIVEERTRDQSYKLVRLDRGALTGDPDIDDVLLRYRRPMQMGAA